MDLPKCISGTPNITTAGVACNSTFSMHVLVWLALVKNYSQPLSITPPGGGGYCHIWAIWVCAAVKGMVFKQFTLG